MIYVHRSNQTLNECCGCLITPNGLQTLSVQSQLTANTLTGVIPNNGVIQVISTATNSSASATSSMGTFGVDGPAALNNSIFCDPSAAYAPIPYLRAWVTHIQQAGVAYPITETELLQAPLSVSEENSQQQVCNFIVTEGSGQGICDCGQFEE